MSGKRAKMRYFPYIKQNSIAEIVSTIESFLYIEYVKTTASQSPENAILFDFLSKFKLLYVYFGTVPI
jgi:hypothetical protein